MLNVKLERLSKIGNRDGILYVISCLRKGVTSQQSLKTIAETSRDISSTEIDGIVMLLESMELIGIDNGIINCSDLLINNYEKEEDCIIEWFTLYFIEFVVKENIIEFNSISYEISIDRFVMASSSIKRKHACYRNVLIDLGVITLRPDTRYIINEKLDVFLRKNNSKKITEKQLLDSLQKKREEGERGELFVEQYEKKRITKDSLKCNIKRISPFDVAAGFDIVSYNNNDSIVIDRFIEVKTYVGSVHFNWSKNEIEKAKLMGNQYYLYLVDDDCIDKIDYEPMIIQNPAISLIESGEWTMEPESYYVERIIENMPPLRIPSSLNVTGRNEIINEPVFSQQRTLVSVLNQANIVIKDAEITSENVEANDVSQIVIQNVQDVIADGGTKNVKNINGEKK
jgi:hypothetical protein